MKDFKFNKAGTIDCYINHKTLGMIPTTLAPEKSQEIIDSGVEIAPYAEPVKTTEQLRGEVIAELSALDASPRLIEGVLLGNKYSIDKLAENESLKAVLRDKLAAI
tara:strand:+ start:7592 stop:7909 length:318 start_codon:yes stop_codon:yes gene_type:complete